MDIFIQPSFQCAVCMSLPSPVFTIFLVKARKCWTLLHLCRWFTDFYSSSYFPLPLEYPCPPPQTTGSMPGMCHHTVACSRSFLPVLANNWAPSPLPHTQWRWSRANISCKRSGREVSRLLFAGVGGGGGGGVTLFSLLAPQARRQFSGTRVE
jgi:hypothetical protein